MKVLVVGGFLGSGKTTTILRIGKYLGEKGQKAAIIVNEIGEIGVDGDVISSYGFDSVELTNGCICCTLKRDLKYTVSQIKKDFDPQILIIEPTGIAFPATIRDEIMLMNLDDVDFAPLVTLVDGSRFKQVMKETKQFSQRQIIDAEILAINKIDLIEELYIPVVESSIKQLNPEAEILRFSAKADYGELSGFIEHLLGDVVYPRLAERKINAERKMNSIQCSNMATYASEFTLNNGFLETSRARSIASILMNGLKEEIVKMNPEFVGHLKIIFQTGMVKIRSSVTGACESPQTEMVESFSHQPSIKILSAVSNVSRSELMELVDFFVKEIFTNHGIKIVKTAVHQHNHDNHNHSEGV